jgi:hypothetical protein
MTKYFIARMKWATFLRLKQELPVEKGETMAHYFERVYRRLKNGN